MRAYQSKRRISGNGWHNWNGQYRPVAEYYNGATYFTDQRDNGNGTKEIRVWEYDHAAETWNGPTEIDHVPDHDTHKVSSLTVDSDGYIYVSYNFRYESHVAKSDSPEDISSFSDTGFGGGGDLHYCLTNSVGTDVFLITREGNASEGEAVIFDSTDGGSSWSKTTLTDDIDRAYYSAASDIDGTDIHFLEAGRVDAGGPFDFLLHLIYDTGTGTLRSTSGSEITTPATQSELLATDSVISDSSDTQYGSGLTLMDGTPHVAYLEGATSEILTHAVWTGSGWVKTTVHSNVPSPNDNGFNGGDLQLSTDGSELRITENVWLLADNDNAFGAFVSTDGGSSWGSRQTLREFSSTNAMHNHQLVRNRDNSLTFVAVQETANNVGSDVFALDYDGEDANGFEFRDVTLFRRSSAEFEQASPKTRAGEWSS